MTQVEQTSTFQRALEAVEAWSPEAQVILVDIIHKRLKQQPREQLLKEVKEAEQEYTQGRVHRGSVLDLLAELDE